MREPLCKLERQNFQMFALSAQFDAGVDLSRPFPLSPDFPLPCKTSLYLIWTHRFSQHVLIVHILPYPKLKLLVEYDITRELRKHLQVISNALVKVQCTFAYIYYICSKTFT